jgi:hypothetical protein
MLYNHCKNMHAPFDQDSQGLEIRPLHALSIEISFN